MNPEYNDTDLIERYLAGKLEGEELHNFENRMQQDSSFAELVNAQTIASDILEDYELLQIKKQMQKEMPEFPKGNGNNFLIYSILALVLSATVGGYFLLKEKNKDSETVRIESEKKESPIEVDHIEEPSGENKISGNTTNKVTVIDTKSEKNLNENKIETSEKQITPTEPEKVGIYTPPVLAENWEENLKREQCAKLIIDTKIETGSSCEEKNNGFIKINILNGGSEPYSFKIKEKGKYTSFDKFELLSSGDYQVWIKEGSGCIYEVPSIVKVGTKECKEPFNATFTPSQEPYWKLPVEPGQSGKMKFQDKSGRLVHEIVFQDGQPSEWDGINLKGEITQGGYYYVIIELSDGKIEYGYLTINR